MSSFYAQLNDADVCITVCQLTSADEATDKIVPIGSIDTTLLGKVWDGTTFVDPE